MAGADGWDDLPADVLAIATGRLTAKQLEAWRLELQGYGTRGMALVLGISRSSAIDRLAAAHRVLRLCGVRQDASGRYHMARIWAPL